MDVLIVVCASVQELEQAKTHDDTWPSHVSIEFGKRWRRDLGPLERLTASNGSRGQTVSFRVVHKLSHLLNPIAAVRSARWLPWALSAGRLNGSRVQSPSSIFKPYKGLESAPTCLDRPRRLAID